MVRVPLKVQVWTGGKPGSGWQITGDDEQKLKKHVHVNKQLAETCF